MTKFEEEFNYLIELSGKVLIGQVDAEVFEKNRVSFFEKYETDQQQALPVVPEFVAKDVKRLSLSTLADWNVAVSYISKETLEWLSTTGNINVFLGKSWTLCSLKINGFKVEKPQLFRLKLKNATISNYYLWLNQSTGKVFVDKKFLDWTNHNNVKNIFTEHEIAKISDGTFVNNEAFELVPVEDGE